MKFEIGDKKLIDDHKNNYQVILDDDIGLVATSGFTVTDPNTRKPIVLALTFIVEKSDGHFHLFGSALPKLNIFESHGYCVQN